MFDYRSDPSHYLDATQISMADPMTRASDALQRMSSQSAKVLVVLEGDRPAWLFNGRALATEVVKESAFDAPLIEFLPGGKWGAKLENDRFEIDSRRLPLRPDDSVRASVPLGSAATVRQVYPLFEDGRFAGVLFSNESFKGSAVTAPPTYKCKRGHINRDPDRGRCLQCPAKLDDVV